MILDAEGMQAGKGRQGIGHLGEGGGLGAARKGAETPGDHLAADVARLLGPAGGLREQHGIVANEGGQRLDHLRVEHRRLRAARAAGEIVHPGEHMVAHEGLLAAQGHGQIAHVPRAQLGERALGLMGHKAAHGGDMGGGNAHETRKLKPVLAKDGAHGQGVLLEDGRILRAVGRFHRLAGQLARANEQARVLVAGLLGQHRALYLYQTENALVLVRDRQAALVGDVCSEWEASQLVRLLRCEGIDRLELLLCTSPTTDDSAGIDLLLEEIDAKAAVIPPGNFTPHIRQALGGQLIPSGQGVGAQLLGDVQLQFDRNGVQLHAGDKKLLKTGRSYGIIEQDPNGWDAVLDSDGWQLRDKQGMTLVWTLEQQPALRVKL